ncbi:MAG: glycosyltransferase [Verrucomicrobiales bacterium]|nr:glycosyltransferase [Verrucomicrobiales bacterium]
MKCLVLDPSLITVLSHNYSEARALRREADRLGLITEFYCHLEAHDPILQIPATPYFHQHGFGQLKELRPAADFMAINFSNAAMRKDLMSLSKHVTADDFVVFPTVTCNLILGICEWVAQLTEAADGIEGIPRMAMCLMFPPHLSMSRQRSEVADETYRQAFARLPDHWGSRIHFTCEVDATGDLFEPLLGARPLTLAVPTWTTAEAAPHRVADTLRIGILGSSRPEKGFHLLPEIIRRVRAQQPGVMFTVQAIGYDPEYSDPVRRELETLKTEGDVFLGRPLTDDEFSQTLRSCRLLLLPYDRDCYEARGSSLSHEAKLCGIPTVIPEGVGFGKESQAAGCAEKFDRFEVEAISAATIRALDRIDSMTTSAIDLRSKYVSSSEGRYLEALLEGFEIDPRESA